MRLNAYLARAGIASRRGADKLIKAGKVTINGQTAELHAQVGDNDKIQVNGQLIKSQKLRYILMNKPQATVTTLNDSQGRRTVNQIINIPERVVPVGRLDYDTTGALLLTNDGDLAHTLMHPSFEVDKVYEAKIQGTITTEKINQLIKGVQLGDGLSAPAKARQLSDNSVEITVHEGRKHQVKRMMEAVGLAVIRLHRKDYAGLKVDDLPYGKWRELTEAEIHKLGTLRPDDRPEGKE